MRPFGCFPLWGREGVILQAAAENKRIETKEDSTELVNHNLSDYLPPYDLTCVQARWY